MARFREGKLTEEQREVFLEQMFTKGRRVGYAFDTEDDLTWVYINAGSNGLCLRSDGCSSGLLNGRYGTDRLAKGDEGTIDLHWIQVPRPWVDKLMDKFMPGGGARARREEVEAAIQVINLEDKEVDPVTRDAVKLARIVVGALILWTLVWAASRVLN